ncbi:MAG TPA: hypothetical protein ENI33_07125 [Thermoplasmatales archaeon]|nr:hypothetical protein [Thermoplasmatales archaeon]
MNNLFEKCCKFAVKNFYWIVGDIEKFSKKTDNIVSKEFIESLNFTGMEVEAYEVLLFSYVGAIFSFIFVLAVDLAVISLYKFSFGRMGILTIFILAGITIAFPLSTLHFISEYPKTKAKYMKMHSLGDIPEILCYIVMYLKLIPNLENAIHFASKESKTSLARDLRKLMWDLEIKVHNSIDNALTFFANVWGRWNEYLKRSIYLIRSAIHERSESERMATLDRGLDIVLEGTKSTMVDFVNKMHQPVLAIYSFGVMIPLALVAILPAVAIVGLKISIFQIILIYDFILPLILFFYIRKILLTRPATFNPPSIPKKHPALNKIKRKRNLLFSIVTGVGISFLIFLSIIFPSINFPFPSALFILWGITAGISIYCLKTYTPYKKIRDEIKEMEKEFGDSLYVIGKRIMEGRSAEEAFDYAGEALRGMKMGEIFRKTAFNLLSMRMDVHDALFDNKFGSLKDVYSERIKAIMKLFVEGMKKSYVIAGTAVIKIADHLKQLQDVEKSLKNALNTITSTLRSTASLFAPFIAGVTLGITKMISNVLGKMNMEAFVERSSYFFGIPDFAIENVNPEYFVFAVGIYIIQIVFLLIRFANGIDEGDDRIQYMYNLGKSLPSAMAFFSIVTIFSIFIFRGMV